MRTNTIDSATYITMFTPPRTPTTSDYRAMEEMASDYRQVQARIKDLQEEADRLKAEMIRELDYMGIDKVRAGEYTISHTIYDRTSVDTKALKAAGLYDTYSKTTTSLRFTVN